jgi:hypothetical protein
MGPLLFIMYALFGKLTYELLKRYHGKDADGQGDDRGLHVLFAIIWPLTAFGFCYYSIVKAARVPSRPTPSAFDYSGPFEPWQPKPPAGDYNANTFRPGKEESAEDMAAFIKSLESRPDAPLPDALTFSYSLTGISKTYPKGTLFPSALIRDWKRGFYMGEEKLAAEDER